jgi:hypothetical protein
MELPIEQEQQAPRSAWSHKVKTIIWLAGMALLLVVLIGLIVYLPAMFKK